MSPFDVALIVSGVLRVFKYHDNGLGSYSWFAPELAGDSLCLLVRESFLIDMFQCFVAWLLGRLFTHWICCLAVTRQE